MGSALGIYLPFEVRQTDSGNDATQSRAFIMRIKIGGMSFPSTLGRIHLFPGEAEGGGGGGGEPAAGGGAAGGSEPGAVGQSGGSGQGQGSGGANLNPGSSAYSPGGQSSTGLGQATPPNQSQTQDGGDGWQSVRDVISQRYNYQFPTEVADDNAALEHLIGQIRQSAQANESRSTYEQLGRVLGPRAAEIQRFLDQNPNGQPGGGNRPTERPTWQPPQFDKRWLGLVSYDETNGVYVGRGAGVPPEVVQAVNDYQGWRNSFLKIPPRCSNRSSSRPLARSSSRTISGSRSSRARRTRFARSAKRSSRRCMPSTPTGGRLSASTTSRS